MKNIKRLFLNTFFLLLSASTVVYAQNTDASVSVNEDFAQTEPGIMMQDIGALWVQNQNGIMIWAANVKRGERMEIYLTDQIDAYGNLLEDKKTAWRVSNGESAKNEFVRVRYNNTDYWVISNRLSKAFKTGRIATACAVYRSLDLSDVRINSLPEGTLVCIGQDFPVTEKINFTEVTFFDSYSYSTVTAYVLSEKVSEDQ